MKLQKRKSVRRVLHFDSDSSESDEIVETHEETISRWQGFYEGEKVYEKELNVRQFSITCTCTNCKLLSGSQTWFTEQFGCDHAYQYCMDFKISEA